jgi:phage virion morphogenesis protein
MNEKFNFGRVIENFKRVKVELPLVLANVTRNDFAQNFKDESFEGQHWQDVKRRIGSGKGRSESAILVQSGALRRAVLNSLKVANFDIIKFVVTDVDYASVHNYGLRAGRGKGFNMPKRQFMGDTHQLRAKQLEKIRQYVDRIWQA